MDQRHNLKIIDEQYFMFISSVSSNAVARNTTEVSKECRDAGSDPIGLLVCRMAYYTNGGRKNTTRFVEQFPKSDRNIRALWVLDDIASRGGLLPELFRPDGPADLYISELFRIVQAGSAAALDAYMRLYCRADGIYAEYMENELETLFGQNIEVVVRNWPEVKRCEPALSNLQQELSADQKQAILANAHEYCHTNPIPCKELADLFSH